MSKITVFLLAVACIMITIGFALVTYRVTGLPSTYGYGLSWHGVTRTALNGGLTWGRIGLELYGHPGPFIDTD